MRLTKNSFALSVFIIASVMVLQRCASFKIIPAPTPSVTPSPQASPSPSPAPSPSPSRPVVTKGWLPEYSQYVHDNVPASLVAYPPESVCPSYSNLSNDQKRTFWADWMQSIASPESGYNRLDLYYESGISDPDSVTGLHNVSEGLLQLSYGDYQCQGIFNYQADKNAFLDDYARLQASVGVPHVNGELSSNHPERSILDPYKNLQCGIAIMNTFFAGHPERGFQSWGAKYWSTIGDGSVLSFFNSHFASLCK